MAQQSNLPHYLLEPELRNQVWKAQNRYSCYTTMLPGKASRETNETRLKCEGMERIIECVCEALPYYGLALPGFFGASGWFVMPGPGTPSPAEQGKLLLEPVPGLQS